MTKRIHPNTIEEVRLSSNIVTVISDYVALSKRGENLVGSCPFCNEQPKSNILPNDTKDWTTRTSFTVSPTKGMYYCFNCHAGGNVFAFLRQIENRLFTDVVIDLANKCGVSVRFFGDITDT